RTGRAWKAAPQYGVDHLASRCLAGTAGHGDYTASEAAPLPIGRAPQGLLRVVDPQDPSPRRRLHACHVDNHSSGAALESVDSEMCTVLPLARQRQKNVARMNVATVDADVAQAQRSMINARPA